MSAFGINVLDFGAKGDGITDDIAAIQSAINYAADRGVYDPENRLHGSLSWHKPWGKQEFPVCGAECFEGTHF